MNAGGVDKACKSNATPILAMMYCLSRRESEAASLSRVLKCISVDGIGVAWQTGSERVGTYPEVVNNPEKSGTMHDVLYGGKIYRFGRGLRPIS